MIWLRFAFSITLLLAGLFSPVAPEAQQAAKVARIGYLPLDLAGGPDLHEAFRQGLRDLGYVEGRNLRVAGEPTEKEMLKGAEVAGRRWGCDFNSLRREVQTISTGPSRT
jgi:hypothetical protein